MIAILAAALIGQAEYKPTEWTQRLVILNNAPNCRWVRLVDDDHFANAPSVINPNRTIWAKPGGWVPKTETRVMAFIPGKVRTWTEAVPVANAGTKISRLRWAFPDGTRFVEELSHAGRTFELRERSKRDGVWKSEVTFRERDAAPVGYVGAGRTCKSCHDRAGASEQYGITVRGDDTVFGWNPGKEHK